MRWVLFIQYIYIYSNASFLSVNLLNLKVSIVYIFVWASFLGVLVSVFFFFCLG